MSTRFFSRHAAGRGRPAGDAARGSAASGAAGLEHQQALLISALRRANGAPVSYAQLRDAGVEFPASVVSELQLAGVPIEYCHGEALGDRGGVGVRLEPGAVQAVAPESVAPAVRALAPSPGPGRRLAAPLALITTIAVVAAIVVVALTAGGGPAGKPVARRPPVRTRTTPTIARVPASTHSTPLAPPQPVSPALATELEARGHDLLEGGQYTDAVPVLRDAVLATGENLDSCRDPVNSTCLTYAYALYDLGRALRLSGDPAAAVSILERRLEIDNQRPTVEAELQLARQDAS